jgi:hypothetical protein
MKCAVFSFYFCLGNRPQRVPKLQRIQSESERPLNYTTTKEGRKVIDSATLDQLVKCFAEETQGNINIFAILLTHHTKSERDPSPLLTNLFVCLFVCLLRYGGYSSFNFSSRTFCLVSRSLQQIHSNVILFNRSFIIIIIIITLRLQSN